MSGEQQYHGYLDRFSILGQCVVAEGWANLKDVALWYKDHLLAVSIVSVQRPELASHFGAEASGWGFSLAAALPEKLVDRTAFRLRFNAGVTVDPTTAYFRAEDLEFKSMVDGFCASVQPGSSLLEIGSRARSGAVYREWFPPELDYVGLDVSEGPNVDVVGDAHHLSRAVDRQFDHVFSMATFEHIIMPWKVALEMNKVMRPGGTALIISHGAWPLHEEPWDFFRFSKESWRGIFNEHTGFKVRDARYQYGAALVPQYLQSHHHAEMSMGRTYLLSGCVVERTHDAMVTWDAEAGLIYDLSYNHG